MCCFARLDMSNNNKRWPEEESPTIAPKFDMEAFARDSERRIAQDTVATSVPANSGAVLVITLQDGNVWGGYVGAKHGQPSDRDTHIPLIFSGRGIKPGRYADRADAVDIAPTLCRWRSGAEAP